MTVQIGISPALTERSGHPQLNAYDNLPGLNALSTERIRLNERARWSLLLIFQIDSVKIGHEPIVSRFLVLLR